mmetsp:Transcript_52509/g.97227  ORF Transcript_52509/g.97227 Transcript_52509/m.97227 type:complete len:90 (+) Transcript_52509:1-270(+)
MREHSNLNMETDLLNVDPVEEESKHKLKKFVQAPDSFFMDVKCPSCGGIKVVFSHAKSVVYGPCGAVLATPTAGKVKLVEKSAYRRKGD